MSRLVKVINLKERTYRAGCWWKSTKFYRAWKPAHEKAVLKTRIKDNPEWGTW
ncbi:hypothetical protein hairong_141 [Pseudomonas phage hairong]|nr:hypothetical protein hairong_141 [Pseudomonas phage hairong]